MFEIDAGDILFIGAFIGLIILAIYTYIKEK